MFQHLQCWRISSGGADYCVSVKCCIARQPEGCAWGVGGRFVGTASLWPPAGHKGHMAGIHQTAPSLSEPVGTADTRSVNLLIFASSKLSVHTLIYCRRSDLIIDCLIWGVFLCVFVLAYNFIEPYKSPYKYSTF